MVRYSRRHCRHDERGRLHVPRRSRSTRCIPPPARPRRSSISSTGFVTPRSVGRSAPLRAAASARHRRRDDRGRAGRCGDARRGRGWRRCVRPARVPVPGRARRADLLDAAFLGGTAAHGIELDDGYRHGSAHCGCTVIPAALSVAYDAERRRQGADRGDRGRLRDRDHARRAPVRPTCASAASIRPARSGRSAPPWRPAKLRGLPAAQASPCARARGVERGRTVRLRQRRRRHQAAARRPCLARRPAGRAAGRAGRRRTAQRDRERATASCRRSRSAAPTRRAPSRCRRPCRSASPTATSSRMPAAATSSRRSRRCSACSTTRRSQTGDIERVEVETYKIAAEHAHTGWDDFASAQLSFPYLMGVAARYRGISFAHFDEQTRADPAFGAFAKKLDGDRADRDRRALSAAAPGARHRDDAARQVHPAGRRSARLAPCAARRRGTEGEVRRSGRAGVRRGADDANWRNRFGRSKNRATLRRFSIPLPSRHSRAHLPSRRSRLHLSRLRGRSTREARREGAHIWIRAACPLPTPPPQAGEGADRASGKRFPSLKFPSLQTHANFGKSASALVRSMAARCAGGRSRASWVLTASAMTRGLANG